MGKRRRSRSLALECLYSLELNPGSNPEQRLLELAKNTGRRSPEVETFARKLVLGVHAREAYLNKLISRYALKWSLDRIACNDRHILRLSLYEMLFCADEATPAVCIDEAVELAKKYSTGDSYRFINGILNKIKEDWEAKKLPAFS